MSFGNSSSVFVLEINSINIYLHKLRLSAFCLFGYGLIACYIDSDLTFSEIKPKTDNCCSCF